MSHLKRTPSRVHAAMGFSFNAEENLTNSPQVKGRAYDQNTFLLFLPHLPFRRHAPAHPLPTLELIDEVFISFLWVALQR
ncbi:MAG: hypothetical protein WCG83_04730 [Candidatus Peregrinibacteria bacterium]